MVILYAHPFETAKLETTGENNSSLWVLSPFITVQFMEATARRNQGKTQLRLK